MGGRSRLAVRARTRVRERFTHQWVRATCDGARMGHRRPAHPARLVAVRRRRRAARSHRCRGHPERAALSLRHRHAGAGPRGACDQTDTTAAIAAPRAGFSRGFSRPVESRRSPVILERLRAMATKPTTVTRARRCAHLALCGAAPLVSVVVLDTRAAHHPSAHGTVSREFPIEASLRRLQQLDASTTPAAMREREDIETTWWAASGRC